jgi:hypothetical protein
MPADRSCDDQTVDVLPRSRAETLRQVADLDHVRARRRGDDIRDHLARDGAGHR